jgi:hypothetical protein
MSWITNRSIYPLWHKDARPVKCLCLLFAAWHLCASTLLSLLILQAFGTICLANKLHLKNGKTIEVEEVWEDSQGVWYKRNGITTLLERSAIRSIERAKSTEEVKASIDDIKDVDATAIDSTSSSAPIDPKELPLWIYLVGGARFQVDEVSETPTGVWYRSGSMTRFLERARVAKVEREKPATSGKSWKERGWTTGSSRLDALIRSNGARYGVDPYLIFCVMEQESHFNSRAVSPAGARGLMQLMPGTAARFGVRRPHDPAQNIMGGTRYLKELMLRFRGRVDLVLAGYNAGEGNVMRYGHRVPPFRETRNYVRRVGGKYKNSKVEVKKKEPEPITLNVQ